MKPINPQMLYRIMAKAEAGLPAVPQGSSNYAAISAPDSIGTITIKDKPYKLTFSEWTAYMSLKKYFPVVQVDNNHVVGLCFGAGNYDSVPLQIREFKKLRTLNLSRSSIKQVENLDGLDELEALSLHDCMLREFKGFENFRNLTHLDIGYNFIPKLEKINLPQLKTLVATSNLLKEVGDLCLPSLEDLDLRFNTGLWSVKGLLNLPSLKKVRVSAQMCHWPPFSDMRADNRSLYFDQETLRVFYALKQRKVNVHVWGEK